MAWWECIPRYSPGIRNSGSVSYPHFPSGKPVWPHIAQFQNRQTKRRPNTKLGIPANISSWGFHMLRFVHLIGQTKIISMVNLEFEKSTRKRSSCAISILEWAGGTVLGERSWRGRGGETITVARSWLRHRQLYIRQPGKRQPGRLLWVRTVGLLFLSPNIFSSF